MYEFCVNAVVGEPDRVPRDPGSYPFPENNFSLQILILLLLKIKIAFTSRLHRRHIQ